MCVVANVATAFELATTNFCVKTRKLHWVKKRMKYKNIEYNWINAHDNTMY